MTTNIQVTVKQDFISSFTFITKNYQNFCSKNRKINVITNIDTQDIFENVLYYPHVPYNVLFVMRMQVLYQDQLY